MSMLWDRAADIRSGENWSGGCPARTRSSLTSLRMRNSWALSGEANSPVATRVVRNVATCTPIAPAKPIAKIAAPIPTTRLRRVARGVGMRMILAGRRDALAGPRPVAEEALMVESHYQGDLRCPRRMNYAYTAERSVSCALSRALSFRPRHAVVNGRGDAHARPGHGVRCCRVDRERRTDVRRSRSTPYAGGRGERATPVPPCHRRASARSGMTRIARHVTAR